MVHRKVVTRVFHRVEADGYPFVLGGLSHPMRARLV